MKRQRGRNRGGGSGGGGGQGGGKPQHNINRAFESNGPDNIKVRGNAQHVYERYQGLARDATLSGDRVTAENHLQHAEHYFRTLRAIQPTRAASEIVSRDTSSNGDIDFEDEAVETAMEEADAQAAARAADALNQPQGQPAEAMDGAPNTGVEPARFDQGQGQRREWRDRPERQDRGDRPQGEFRGDRNFNDRQDRPQGDRQDRPQGDRQQGEFRGDRQGQGQGQGQERQGQGQGEFRGDRPRFRDRDDRFRDSREPRNEVAAERPARDDRPLEPRGDRPRFRDRDDRRFEPREGEAAPAAAAESAAPEPARSEPRPEARPEPVLRSEDGGVSQLPGFLQPPVPSAEGEGEARRRPRRRRTREDGDAPASTTPEVEEA